MITFSDNIARKPYLGSTEIAEVWLGNTLIYPDTPIDYSSKYFTIQPLENGTTVKFNQSGLSYSLDDGSTWTSLAADTYTPSLNAGQKVLFKGQLTPAQITGIGRFQTNLKTFNVEGNPMSLLFGDNFIGEYDLTGFDYAFTQLFLSSKVVNAKNLALVATTLSQNCYAGMFYFCNQLTTVPELPATTLAVSCYQDMFNGCTSLTTVPELPATTLANVCYNGMFKGCTSLTTAPELPATTLAIECYGSMFYGCTSLVTAPELPATTLYSRCYTYMFQNCSNLNSIRCYATDISAINCTLDWVNGVAASGTFTKNLSMSSWTTGNDGIPNGWTVEEWVDDSKLVKTVQNITTTYYTTKILNRTDDVQYQIIDNVIQPNVVTSYRFETTGEHLVNYQLSGTSIGVETFRACENITEVTIPNNITSLNSGCFSNCSNITSLTIPNGVTNISEYAFQLCRGLTAIIIPNSVTNIAYRSFNGCTGLTSITVEATRPPTLGIEAFNNTNDCPIYVPAASVNTYKTTTEWSRYASRIFAIPQ